MTGTINYAYKKQVKIRKKSLNCIEIDKSHYNRNVTRISRVIKLDLDL